MTPEAFNLFWSRAKFETTPGKFLFGWYVRGVNHSPGAFLPEHGPAINLFKQDQFLTLAARP